MGKLVYDFSNQKSFPWSFQNRSSQRQKPNLNQQASLTATHYILERLRLRTFSVCLTDIIGTSFLSPLYRKSDYQCKEEEREINPREAEHCVLLLRTTASDSRTHNNGPDHCPDSIEAVHSYFENEYVRFKARYETPDKHEHKREERKYEHDHVVRNTKVTDTH